MQQLRRAHSVRCPDDLRKRQLDAAPAASDASALASKDARCSMEDELAALQVELSETREAIRAALARTAHSELRANQAEGALVSSRAEMERLREALVDAGDSNWVLSGELGKARASHQAAVERAVFAEDASAVLNALSTEIKVALTASGTEREVHPVDLVACDLDALGPLDNFAAEVVGTPEERCGDAGLLVPSLRLALLAARERCAESEAVAASLRAKCAESDCHASELTAQLDEARACCAEAEFVIADLERRLTVSDSNGAELQSQLSELEAKLSKLSSRAAHSDSLVSELRSQLVEAALACPEDCSELQTGAFGSPTIGRVSDLGSGDAVAAARCSADVAHGEIRRLSTELVGASAREEALRRDLRGADAKVCIRSLVGCNTVNLWSMHSGT